MTQIFGGTHIFKELEGSVEQACRLIILFVRQNDISNARFDYLKEEIPEYYATLQTNPSLVRKSWKRSITWIAVHRLNGVEAKFLFLEYSMLHLSDIIIHSKYMHNSP